MQIVLLIHNTTQCMETLHKQPLSRSSQNNLSLHTTLHTLTNKSLQFFSWSKIPRISGKPHVHYRIHNRCYKLHPSHHSSSDRPNNIRWPVQTTQLLTVQPSPSARHFHPVSLNASLRTVLSLSHWRSGSGPPLWCVWPLHSHAQLYRSNTFRNFVPAPYIPKCSVKDPNINTCALNNAKKTLPHLIKGRYFHASAKCHHYCCILHCNAQDCKLYPSKGYLDVKIVTT